MTRITPAVLVLMAFQWTASVNAQQVHRVPGSYLTIQSAIHAAQHGDTVEIAPGIYTERIDLLGKSLTIIGLAGPDHTIIDGGMSGTVIQSNPTGSGSAYLEGLQIINGRGFNGGGVHLETASGTTMVNCVVRDCEALNHGGGCYFPAHNPLVIGCRLESCVAGGSGGAIFMGGASTSRIERTTFVANRAQDGGACYASAGDLEFARCLFTQNRAGVTLQGMSVPGRGGAICQAAGGDTIATNCIFDRNISSQSGGAIHTGVGSSDRLTLHHCTLSGNRCDQGSLGALATVAFFESHACIYWDNGQAPIGGGIAGVNSGYNIFEHRWGGVGASSFVTNPLMTDPGNGDFRLRSGSPGIDRAGGLFPPPPTEDHAGAPRLQGLARDIGALEYTQVPISPLSGTGDLFRMEIGRFRHELTLRYYAVASPTGFSPLHAGPHLLAASPIPSGSTSLTESFPGVWLDPANLIVLLNGVTGPSGPQLLSHGGVSLSLIVGPGLEGQSFAIQAMVVHPNARNGLYATTTAYALTL